MRHPGHLAKEHSTASTAWPKPRCFFSLLSEVLALAASLLLFGCVAQELLAVVVVVVRTCQGGAANEDFNKALGRPSVVFRSVCRVVFGPQRLSPTLASLLRPRIDIAGAATGRNDFDSFSFAAYCRGRKSIWLGKCFISGGRQGADVACACRGEWSAAEQ